MKGNSIFSFLIDEVRESFRAVFRKHKNWLMDFLRTSVSRCSVVLNTVTSAVFEALVLVASTVLPSSVEKSAF